jgi:hypothetical protein
MFLRFFLSRHPNTQLALKVEIVKVNRRNPTDEKTAGVNYGQSHFCLPDRRTNWGQNTHVLI